MSLRLSRRLNNATGQCPVVRLSLEDNDGTPARGISTSRCPVVCPVVPSCRRFLDQPSADVRILKCKMRMLLRMKIRILPPHANLSKFTFFLIVTGTLV